MRSVCCLCLYCTQDFGLVGGEFNLANVRSCMKYDIIIPSPISRREFARDISLK